MTNKISVKTSFQQLFEDMLKHGMVQVLVRRDYPDISVPALEHIPGPTLKLNLSWKFGKPMTVEADRIVAMLTFGGAEHECVLPYRSMLSALDTVDQILYVLDHEHKAIRRVSANAELKPIPEEEAVQVPKQQKAAGARRPSHLRVVK